MNLPYPWIPDGLPVEVLGQLAGAKVDLVKGVMRLTLDLEASPENLALRERLRLFVGMERRLAIDLQPLKLLAPNQPRLPNLDETPAAAPIPDEEIDS